MASNYFESILPNKPTITQVRIGTRRSMLAMAQSQIVADALRAVHSEIHVELLPIITGGDEQSGPLAPAGGKGLFTAELEQALRSGEIHLAVHSAKDMPAGMPEEFTIAAVPPREDPRDVFVSRAGAIEELSAGATVGTGSLRRKAQLLAARGDLKVVPIRGNIETRLAKALDPARPEVPGVLEMEIRGNLASLSTDHIVSGDTQAAPTEVVTAEPIQTRMSDVY